MPTDDKTQPVEAAPSERKKAVVGRPFPKGKSGNPGGKQRALIDIDAAIWSQERGRVVEGVNLLWGKAFGGDDVDVPAATLYFDRVLGKTKVRLPDRASFGPSPSSAEELTSEVIASMRGEVKSIAAAQATRALTGEELGFLVSAASVLVKAAKDERTQAEEYVGKMSTAEIEAMLAGRVK